MNDVATKELIEETAKAVVKETFIALGADVEHPLEMQEDFAFLRTWRKNASKAGTRVVLVLVTLVTVGIAGIVWRSTNGG